MKKNARCIIINVPVHNQWFLSNVTSKPAPERSKPEYRKDIKYLFCQSLNQEKSYEEKQ